MTNSTDHARVRHLFHAVCELSPDQRRRHLDEACAGDPALRAEVDALLLHDNAADDLLAKSRVESGPAFMSGAARDASSPIPERIGQYRIIRRIGHGGMGEVFEAEQDSPRRPVALKFIRSGALSPRMLRRFEHESQVLGRLQHPGIAQIYEAGTIEVTPGQRLPFFAMEYIRGLTLLEYASHHKLGARQRLELIALVCDAVYHAHQKGVIHRDLKPGNILVDESGRPKVLDFGVARATDSDLQTTTVQTDIGQLIGTVSYMSPEQVSGDPAELDTRSDVYALGVIAYELLAGRTPHDLSRRMIHEAVRVIREEEPTHLSSIDRTLRGDIETIVAKALEKEKSRRYQSAESMATDIRRYLRDEPISARPASAWYQTRKFARRNRGLVSGLAAAVTLLIAGLIGTTFGLQRAVVAQRVATEQAAHAEAKSEEALREAEISASVSTTLRNVFFMATPNTNPGEEITLRDAIERTVENLGEGFDGPPEAEATLRNTLGIVYRNLGEYDKSETQLNESLAIRRRVLHPDHPDIADTLHNIAVLYSVSGKPEEALPIFEQALEAQRRALGPEDLKVARSMYNLGRNYMRLKKFDLALRILEESLTLHRKVMPDNITIHAMHISTLSTVHAGLGDFARAEERGVEALEMIRSSAGEDDVAYVSALNQLADVRMMAGDPVGAEQPARDSSRLAATVYGPDHPATKACNALYAKVLEKLGKTEEATALTPAPTPSPVAAPAPAPGTP